MRRTLALEIGRCGWGMSGGQVPEVRLGWFRLWTSPGSVISTMLGMRRSLFDAKEELAEGMRRNEP